jgi:hypothetical protein
VLLDLEYLDQIYPNAYVPNLQVSGQVVSFAPASGQSDPVTGDLRQDSQTASRKAIGR